MEAMLFCDVVELCCVLLYGGVCWQHMLCSYVVGVYWAWRFYYRSYIACRLGMLAEFVYWCGDVCENVK